MGSRAAAAGVERSLGNGWVLAFLSRVDFRGRGSARADGSAGPVLFNATTAWLIPSGLLTGISRTCAANPKVSCGRQAEQTQIISSVSPARKVNYFSRLVRIAQCDRSRRLADKFSPRRNYGNQSSPVIFRRTRQQQLLTATLAIRGW